jgi:hypothetical protein
MKRSDNKPDDDASKIVITKKLGPASDDDTMVDFRPTDLVRQGETGMQAIADLPAEWGISIPKSQFVTSFDLSTDDGKRDCYRSLTVDGIAAKQYVDSPFFCVGITISPAPEREIKGELISTVLCRMLRDDGEVIGTNSQWVIRSLLAISQFRGEMPSRKKPWKLAIRSKRTANGNDCLKAIDVEFAAKK